MSRIRITTFKWVPTFAQGLVRDLRVRWALEEAGLPYEEKLLNVGEQNSPAHRALQPFGQVPVYEEDGLTCSSPPPSSCTSASVARPCCPWNRHGARAPSPGCSPR
jgi:hypothetical protein